MTVTVAEPDSPYRPVNRFESLLRETSELRFLRPEVALMEPCLDVLVHLIDDGVDVTLVDRPSCHTYFFSTYPEQSSEIVKRDNFTVLEHDDLLPYGIGLLDDRVAISCYERDSGTVHALIDTDVPAVHEWAESVYASYRSEARTLEPERVVE
jgi:predicted transcriptional regulator